MVSADTISAFEMATNNLPNFMQMGASVLLVALESNHQTFREWQALQLTVEKAQTAQRLLLIAWIEEHAGEFPEVTVQVAGKLLLAFQLNSEGAFYAKGQFFLQDLVLATRETSLFAHEMTPSALVTFLSTATGIREILKIES